MDLHETKKAPNIEVHGGLKSTNGNIRVAQQKQGTKGVTRIKFNVERLQLDMMSTFH
jgi:hypothetical protein